MSTSHQPDVRELFFKIREIAITEWHDRDGVVYYDVVVTASGGRRWTQQCRYQDFQELEMRTWKRRGPMPPFPMPWTPGQVSRRVDPFGRVGRLEAKRIKLEAWLRCLVEKGRMASYANLRSYCVAFLNVEKHCFEPSTPLELVNNDVTALVVANAHVDVPTILLKLSMEVENMKGAKGKDMMDKAKEGPMPKPREFLGGEETEEKLSGAARDQEASLIEVDVTRPPKALFFDLRQERPTVWLRLRNPHDHALAFKVMATRATRYFVQPAQTVLDGGGKGYRDIAIFIPDTTITGDMFEDGRDKFMFMSHPFGSDDDSEAMEGGAVGTKTLAEFWRKASAQSTTRFKLAARFTGKKEWLETMKTSDASKEDGSVLNWRPPLPMTDSESRLTIAEPVSGLGSSSDDAAPEAQNGAPMSSIEHNVAMGLVASVHHDMEDDGHDAHEMALKDLPLPQGGSDEEAPTSVEVSELPTQPLSATHVDSPTPSATIAPVETSAPEPRSSSLSTSRQRRSGSRDAPPGWVWPEKSATDASLTRGGASKGAEVGDATGDSTLSATATHQRLRPRARPKRKAPKAEVSNKLEVNWVEFRRELGGMSPA